MTHPLGYDPDPAARGEGSSTGAVRRRRESVSSASHSASTSTSAPPSPSSPPRKLRRTRWSDEDTDYTPAVTAVPRLVGGGRPRRGAAKRGGGTTPASNVVPRASRSARATRSRRTSATPTTLESIAAESVAIKHEVARLQLTLRDVNADGNCLFRALADQLWGEQSRHAEVRKLVCDHLERARGELGDFVAGFLSEGETYDGYVQRMRGAGVYGSHIELQAATKVFRRSIRVILAQTSYTVEYVGPPAPGMTPVPTAVVATAEPEKQAPQTRRRTRSSTTVLRKVAAEPEATTEAPTEEYTAALAGLVPPARPGHAMLWLALFAEAEHYESIRRGRDSGPADIPDSMAVPHARDVSEAARRERGEPVPELDGKPDNGKDSRLAQVLASLPPGHGLDDAHVVGVLARTKGDVSAAVEILLEDIDVRTESTVSAPDDLDPDRPRRPSAGSTTSATRVEAMLADRESHSLTYRDHPPSSSSSASDHEAASAASGAPSTAPTSPLSTGDAEDASDGETKDDDGLGTRPLETKLGAHQGMG
ncbi:uncharacterized protein EHS24_009149 [Apiotrichum porosum]|uniref:OTU domain-containing protein n=1 Tax=Apiotrichum porosum TaxID=105984 RepID=A0A427XP65_9TREE|nr:uncharacterized protein EHS24_009149 [Apiotrichum porosum]RSH80567.1 hypothetical protein EHS24_009149 [Apiotrichum porosum]